MMRSIVVAGIGNRVGKTLLSAVLTEAYNADYWKPVQAGNLHYTDRDMVRALISNPHSYLHGEAYQFSIPAAPHTAAAMENKQIDFDRFKLPDTSNRLIIELPGGLMAPLTKNKLNIDLLVKWEQPVLLVVQHYAGSISDTLLSVYNLRSHGIPVMGIVYNGESHREEEDYILEHTELTCIARIAKERRMERFTIKRYAEVVMKSMRMSSAVL